MVIVSARIVSDSTGDGILYLRPLKRAVNGRRDLNVRVASPSSSDFMGNVLSGSALKNLLAPQAFNTVVRRAGKAKSG
jgi:hypothetical protein